MQPKLILFLAALLGASAVSSQVPDGRLETPPKSESRVDQTKQEQITVIGSRYLRPNSNYHVLINLINSQVPATFDLQLLGAPGTDREQIEAKSVLAHPNETQTVEFQVGDWPDAEYLLLVNAQAVDKSWHFKDETTLMYLAKTFSGFIQTDRATYKPGQLVQFRALFLTQTLTPFVLKQGEINVTVEDPARNVIAHWPSLSNYRGLLSLELPLSDDPMLGDYTIKISAKGQEFRKSFTVAEYVLPTYEVSIQLPPYATYNESNVVATVRAIYTYGKPVKGHVTLSVQPLARFSNIEARPMEQAQFRARLEPDGSADFAVDLIRDAKLARDELFERDMEFFALVEEDSTSRKYNVTKSLRIYNDKFKVERLGDKNIKPGLPKVLRYKVAYQDGLPVENNGPPLELAYKVLDKTLQSETLVPVDGIVEHWLNRTSLEPPSESEGGPMWPIRFIEVSADYRNKTHYLDGLRVESTDSKQFLQISLPQLERVARRAGRRSAGERPSAGRKEVGVGDQLDIQLRSTEPIQDLDVTCQGLARGDIAWALSRRVPPAGANKNVTSTEFQVRIEPKMVPQMTIVCFYVRPQNKELIADSTKVNVHDKSAKNLAKITTSRDEAKPGQDLEVSVLTKPNSLVGVLAIDQSSLLLKSGNDLNSDEITNDLKSYGGDASEGDNFDGESTKDLFRTSDLVILTNNLMHEGHYYRRFFWAKNHRMMLTVASANEGLNLQAAPASLRVQPPEYHLKRKGSDDQQVRIRTAFPETWIWLNATADTSGKVQFDARVPDTITSWQLSAFSLNENYGLALNSGKTSVRVFRPFFIKLNLPYSIIRKEIVSIQAMVFNYSKRPMKASVTLDNSRREFRFVEASNSIGDERAQDEQTSATQLVELPPNEGVSVSFLIEPVKLGHIDIKVLARGDLVSDGVVRKLLVKAEGQTQHFNKAMLVKLKRGADAWRQNVSLPVPANAVEGSQKVYVSAIGDILGAGLSNIDNLLRLPDGCGEQNMINLVPNIVIMNYLSKTNRLRDVQRDRAKRNIQVGYQRELNYKRSDGSFSAFGQSDKNGSVWLTAYVLKTFQQAQSIVTVDQSVLEMATSFLVSNWLEDGSIAEVGMLHHKDLASKSLGDGNKSLYLTAYSLIALMQQPHAQGSEQAKVLERGLDFLEQKLASSIEADLGTYDLAIVAYALELSGRRKQSADRAYDMLWARAIESADGNQIHWSNRVKREVEPDAEPAPVEEVALEGSSQPQRSSSPRSAAAPAKQQVAPPLKSFAVNSDQSAHLVLPDSLDVEITSLALLAAVRRNELDRSLPIVRWLVANQNSLGGYSSTQDTVLAIEALANYAEASVNSISDGASSSSSPAQSIEVEFVYPREDPNSIRKHNLDQLLISRSNSLVQQQTRLPDNITWVQIKASGVGLAVVQVSWQYNLMVSAERPAFYLNPIIETRSSTDFLQLSVCTFYKAGDPEDRQAASNMALLEVELPSGYVADAEALHANTRHPLIKRIETPDGETRVLFYLDKVTRDELCLTVPAHRSSKVANNQPVPVTIYDYYERDQAARVFYKPPTASSCDICESESCAKACQTESVPSSGSVPLHEQRRLRLQAASEARDRLDEARNTTERNARLTESSQNETSSGIIDAYKLLPVTSAFSAINEAAKSLNASSLRI